MRLHLLLTSHFLFSFFLLVAQNETSKWYFGQYAAVDFMSNPPMALNNSTMSVSEGCASIADGSGNLLFYTDGISVYNTTHSGTLMANGGQLSWGGTPTQSSIILKRPGSASLYYLFTLGQYSNTPQMELSYATIDMSLAAGLGSVTTKNNSLVVSMTEKLTAVRHSNGTDFWVLAHKWNSDQFLAYLITAAGINTTPVVSAVGSVHSVSEYGVMKFSPNGRKVGLVQNGQTTELFDFDPNTGQLFNPQLISLVNDSISSIYGCEFSPNGSKFYAVGVYPYPNPSFATSYSRVLQWDLCAGSNSAIIASQYTVASSLSGLGPLQLAQDGKTYVSHNPALNVINNPNLAGAACNYSANVIALGTATAKGLPNFMCSYFKDVKFDQAINTSSCAAASFTAPCLGSGNYTGVTWDFGDPASASSNTSNLFSPGHVFSGAGTYTVKLTLHTANAGSDTIRQLITFPGAPALSLSGKQNICNNASTTLSVSGANSYNWSTGASSSTLILSPTVTTVYTVTGSFTNNLCTSAKTVTVSVFPCLGLEEDLSENKIRLFPNPGRGVYTLSPAGPEFTHVCVYDILGEKVLELPLSKSEEQIDLSSFSDGIYLVVLSLGNGQVRNTRIIKVD